MIADALSALVRALSFIAMFQAAGTALLLLALGGHLAASSGAVRRLGYRAALAALPLVVLHYALEAARMAGMLSGTLDADLQQLVLESPLSAAAGARLLGLALIAGTIRAGTPAATLAGACGALLVASAFTFVGHTAQDAHGVWSSLALALHLLVVAFWFGSLAPLHIVSRLEAPQDAAALVAAFTRIATLLVPGLFVMGLLLALALIDRWSVFAQGYGLLLLGKIAGFGALMALAALNRWRYGPAIADSDAGAGSFRRTVVAEYVLICLVLAATAVMTTFFSP